MSLLMVKNKSVNIWGLQRCMQPVLKYAGSFWQNRDVDLIVTSARDGLHSPGSLHYCGHAVDLRTRDFKPGDVWEVAELMSQSLGDDYDVVVHDTHMHVEYDPKGGG